ncbi:MAG TPA: patatin family protein [Spirochaetota bacterium]|nr:patatin family protein [Spirochaetota bacterium]
MNSKNRSALVVEGGGMRGVFSAGVLNSFGTSGFDPFDLYIGVSAGACNLAAHLAQQHERNYHVTVNYSATAGFINPLRFISGGHYMDLDWLWDITIRECRLDLERIFSGLYDKGKEYLVAATSLDSGLPLYLKPDRSNLEHYIKISSSLPVLYRNILYADSVPALDGGIADPIPVIEAYKRGANEITIIRSRPSSYIKKKSPLSFLFPLFFRKYPGLADAMQRRHRVYMDAVDFIKNPPAGVEIYEIAPPEGLNVGRATKDVHLLGAAYKSGINSGKWFIKSRE